MGDVFSPSRLRDDLTYIYKLGFFKDIKINAENFEGGLAITFIVSEKPFIKQIVIKNNDKINENEIRQKISVKVGAIANNTEIEKDIGNGK